MPTIGTTTRDNRHYFGWSKQSVLGTPIAPTQFWRWLEGSDANPEPRMQEVYEGDAGVHINLIYKDAQYWGIRIVEYVRPITAGCAIQALMGNGSDTYTAPTSSTTLAASASAGATTIKLTADLGNTGTKTLILEPGYTSTNAEVVIIDCTTRTTPNYTYTLASSATLALSHNNGSTVISPASHAFTRQLGTFDYYTIERSIYQSGFGYADRIQDCVCKRIRLSGGAKSPLLRMEHDWYGTFSVTRSSLLTPSFEGVGVAGACGGPLLWYGGSAWTLDSLTTGNATSITALDITLENSTNPEDGQGELITPGFFEPGLFKCSGTMMWHFQNYRQYYETYYGTSTVAASATDSYLTGFGQASVTFYGDGPTLGTSGANSLAISIPNFGYTAAKISPKNDGKPLEQSVTFTGSKSTGNANVITLTLTNGQNSAY